MDINEFIAKNKLSGIVTPLGYDILTSINTEVLVAASVDKEVKETNITYLPYEEFFSKLLENSPSTIVFFYNPDYLYLFLVLIEKLEDKHFLLISPFVLDIDIPWRNDFIVGFPTTISYDKFHELRSSHYGKIIAKHLKNLSLYFSRILIIIPNAGFISSLLVSDPDVQVFEQGKNIISSYLAVTDKQASLAAYFWYPDCIIDTCLTQRIFNTTMGGYYLRLVRRSKDECTSLSRLASLRTQGFVLRLTSEFSYSHYPESYSFPKYINYSLVKNNPRYFPEDIYYGLPLSERNNKIVYLWIEKGYEPFSILGPLVILDNFTASFFVYPLDVYKKVKSYLLVQEQTYKTFFSRFVGKDSLETLSNIWEIFLYEVDTFTPTYDEVKSWADNNSISAERLWDMISIVQICVNILQKFMTVKKGPSNSEEVRKRAALLFEEVYSDKIMYRKDIGFEYEDKIYFKGILSLPSKLQEAEKIVGLILDEDTVIAGVALSE